jgi:WD40 repeat protein
MSNLRRLLGLLSLFLLAGCSLFFPGSAPSLPQVWSGTPVPTAVATLSAENASRVVEIARWGKGSISDLAWSPDGQQLAVSTSTGIFLYDAETCQQVKYIPTRYGVTHLAYSSDGKTLAIGDESPGDDAHILDATTGQEIQNLRGSAFVSGLAFLPDSKSLVVAGGNNSIEVWDVNTGWKRKALEDVRVFSSAELAVSPDKNILAAADMETVWLWDLKSGQHLSSLTPKGMATLVSFSPDGKFLATDACGERADQTICTAGEIWLWDTTTWKPVTTLKGNQGWLESIDFSPDGTMLASGGSHDHSLKLWDVKTGQMLRTIDEFTAPVSDVAFSPDGKQIASASRNSGVTMWSTDTYTKICLLADYSDGINNLSLSKDGKLVAAGSSYGTQLRETTQGVQQRVITATDGSIL